MDLDSPKDLMKNIENFFGNASPQSPSFRFALSTRRRQRSQRQPKMEISTGGIAKVLSDSFDTHSPGSALAFDLNENACIKEYVSSRL
ncbi:unnamed protein product [Cyberlindnera jadinii]|uniref:Uncharacterized protein n=1 Tax=Cyberlindnera jadinii (strain ATCC 18201 / CBS 1600 / BCRC 20928 / JCM 3617 / NBRC 0987 / NRRL Y-1542) TaxID=983966 RepID=A0A0H5C9M5_CYBJN|nr:unnamed protein product [Cyberlindnera jadinii]